MKRWQSLAVLLVLMSLLVMGCAQGGEDMTTDVADLYIVEMETSKGTIVMELSGEKMPVTVGNFVGLAQSGFYDGLTFHRVEDWVIQGGDPRGDGTGGSGKTIPLEVHPELRNVRGAVAMARAMDPNSASSQFYILKTDAPWLDGDYAVFGMVTSGMEVVDAMERGDTIQRVTVEAK